MSQSSIPLRNPRVAALLGWLVPGLGHIYQGRIGKGILYAVCILSLYTIGFALGDGKIVYWRWVNPLNNPEKFCLYYLGQFFVGLPALPALIQGTLQYYGHDPILWGFMAEPKTEVLNGLHTSYGKLVEIGSMYTAVAGLLNVLAIYDALEGPAFVTLEDEAPAATAPGSLRRRCVHDSLRANPYLLVRSSARRRDQPGLLRLAPRSVAAHLVACHQAGRDDPGIARVDDGGSTADQHSGLSRVRYAASTRRSR